MSFINESGAILDHQKNPISIIPGTPGAVEFPEEFIWDLHTKSPGCIYALTHVHPPHMVNLSHRDETTLRNWCYALYPFPMRLMTIAATDRSWDFLETCYLGLWEPKEIWLARGKETKRDFRIIKEWQLGRKIDDPLWYGNQLIRMSYGQ